MSDAGTASWGKHIGGMLLGMIIAGLAVPCALAQEKGVTFTDLRGEEHVNAKILRAEAGNVVIMTSSGILKLPITAVPPDIIKKFGITATPPAPAPVEKEKDAPPEAVGAKPTSDPMEGSTDDEFQLAKIRAEMEKMTGEIRNLENSRTLTKDDYNREFEAAKKRMQAQYEIDMAQYEKKNRHRRNPIPEPTYPDPNQDTDVAKLKLRLDQYDEQIKQRRQWLQDLANKERPLANRMTEAARIAATDAAQKRMLEQREEVTRRYAEQQKAAQARYAEDRRQLQERETMEKQVAEKELLAKKEKLDGRLAECGAIMSKGESADVRSAFLKLESLNADREDWDYRGSDGGPRIAEAALGVFDLARHKNELAIATSCLRIAIGIEGDGPRVLQALMRFFDEAADLVKAGDFKGLTHHLEFIKDVGLDGSNMVIRKKHELSDLSLDRGWQALRGLNFATAGSAMDTARRLWDRNPRLGWLRTTISGSFLVGVLVCLIGIFKGVEKLYWWLNRG